MGNYKCEWNDLFEERAKEENEVEVDLINFFKFKTPENYRPSYEPSLLSEWGKTLKRYAKPKQFIMDQIEKISNEYDIPNATCVYFRGTDMLDRPRVAFSSYLEKIPPEGKLWIQSDEIDFIDFMMKRCPSRAFVINGFTFSKRAIHHDGRMNDAIEILVIIHLMAAAKILIANQSNVPWVALMLRETVDGYIPNFSK
jgi:hypothetical protein